MHALDESCSTTYLGTMPLRAGDQRTGIPSGVPVLLVVVFSRSQLTGNSQVSCDTILTPKRNVRYEIAVSSVNDLYDVIVKELGIDGAGPTVLPRRGLRSCRPTK